MKISFRKICLFFIFLENWFLTFDLGFDFRLSYMLFFMLIAIYPITFRKVTINPTLLLVLVSMLLMFLVTPVLGGMYFADSAKQVLLIAFNLVFTFLLINAYGYDIRLLFRDYIEIVYVAALVGIVQIISLMVGFTYGADYSYLGFEMQNLEMYIWVIQSWFQEPSFMAIAFLPVAFAAVCRLMGMTDVMSTQRAIVVLGVFVLSQAATGLIGLMLCIGIIVVKRYSILSSPLAVMASTAVVVMVAAGFYAIPKVQQRIDESAKLFFNPRVTGTEIESVNISTYAIYSNFKVSQAAFYDYPVFGHGLGSYERVYHSYTKRVMPSNHLTRTIVLNDKDANSLLLRLGAETGIVGLLLVIWFIARFRVRTNDLRKLTAEEMDYWIINSGALVVILIRLLRMGHYTTLGFVLVFALYYLSRKAFERVPPSISK